MSIENKVNNIFVNFQARKMKDARSSIDFLSGELAIHTMLILMYQDDQSRFHWEGEVFAWISKMRSLNKIKTGSGHLRLMDIGALIYANHFSSDSDIQLTYESAIGHYNSETYGKDVIKIKKLSDNEIENFRTSLDAIYIDYSRYISYDKKMTESEIKRRISNFYLYGSDLD